MKHTKREWIPLYNFLDRTRLTAHLSEMAARGWLLTSISSWSWKYRRTEPLKFAVTFFAGAGRFSPAPAPGLDTFRDYCAQAGWQVAASMDQVQVFYNEDENAVPLETDSALELANIQKSIGGPLKKSYLALLVLSLFQLGFGLWRLVQDPVDNIGNSSSLLSAGAYLPLSVLVLWGLLAYRRWLRKAGAAAETGAPLPDMPSAKWLSILTMVWSALLVLASFATVSRSAGMVLLLVQSDTGMKILASCVYGISMIFMMTMSSVYHAMRSGSTAKRVCRRFDYVSIYLLIGGTPRCFWCIWAGRWVSRCFACSGA